MLLCDGSQMISVDHNPLDMPQDNRPHLSIRLSNEGASVSKPKILNFAPREEPEETRRALIDAGYDVVAGDRAWHEPRSDHEGAFVAAARDAVAMMGTSIRADAGQPARHGGFAAPAHRREVHGRRRRHRRRGGDRSRHSGVPRADRGQLLRRRREHPGRDADAPEEGARARRRGARRPVARAVSVLDLYRQPPVGRLSRHHGRTGRPGPHRHARRAACSRPGACG